MTRPTPLLLLAYLALEGAKPRRYLAELFFPEAKHNLNSLSRALSYIRQDAPGVLEADDHRAWTLLTTDAKQFETLIQQHHCTEAIALYDAPFLETFNTPLGEELEEWLFTQREHYGMLMQRALLTCAEAEAAKGDFATATQLTERAYQMPEAPPIEPEALPRYYALLQAGGSSLASKVKEEASLYDIRLKQSPTQVKQQLQPAFVGRKRELGCLSTLKAGEWAWVKGGIGIGKTSLLRQLTAIYLPGRSGLPYATLEPYLTDTITSGPEAILRKLYKQSGVLCIDDWENIDSESQDILIKLRNLKPDLSVIISASGSPPFAVNHLLELTPLSREALGDIWEMTGGIPKLVRAQMQGEPLAAALDATLSALPKNTRNVYLCLALLDDPDLSLVRRALTLSAQQMTQALADLLSAGLSAPSGRVWPRQLVRDYLNQHPNVLGTIATRLAREINPLTAFPLYQSSRAFWREDDMAHVRSAYMAWAQELLDRGFPQKAVDTLENVTPDDAINILKAHALEKTGHYKKALEIIQLAPEIPDSLAIKGKIAWRISDFETAEICSLRALDGELGPRAEALNTLAKIYLSKGQFEQAATYFKKSAVLWQALGDNSMVVVMLNNQAIALHYLGQNIESFVQSALETAGDHPQNRANLLLTLSMTKIQNDRLEGVEAILYETLELVKETGNLAQCVFVWNNLGVVHGKRGNVSAAKDAYETALYYARRTGEKSEIGNIMANLAELKEDFAAWEEAILFLYDSGNESVIQEIYDHLPKNHLFRKKSSISALEKGRTLSLWRENVA